MPLLVEPERGSAAPRRKLARTLETWNRKLHYYLGLYFLLFVALFAFTGLLLNHHWKFSEFWPQRKESLTVARVATNARMEDLMRQFGLAGEVHRNESAPGTLDFQVNRP